MKNMLTVDMVNGKIVMDRTFAQKVKNTASDEYKRLQEVRKDYPSYDVVTRTIKKNPQKETYRGLTYGYMEEYILTHGDDAVVQKNLADYRELRLIAKCHGKGKGYPVIKQWFLNTFQEINDFGTVA